MNNNTGAAPPAQAAPAGNAAGQEDYLDKAVDSVEKKLGQMTGHNIDPAKYRGQNEKLTDKIRGFLEKVTGKKAPAKFSN